MNQGNKSEESERASLDLKRHLFLLPVRQVFWSENFSGHDLSHYYPFLKSMIRIAATAVNMTTLSSFTSYI